MPEQLLNGSNIVICLKEVAGKTVSEGVRSDPFSEAGLFHRPPDSPLHMAFMYMKSFYLSGLLYLCELVGGKQPLPDKLAGRIL